MSYLFDLPSLALRETIDIKIRLPKFISGDTILSSHFWFEMYKSDGATPIENQPVQFGSEGSLLTDVIAQGILSPIPTSAPGDIRGIQTINTCNIPAGYYGVRFKYSSPGINICNNCAGVGLRLA